MPTIKNALYFGNKNYMQWVLPPKVDYDASRAKKFTTAQYTNGGAYVRQSATGAKKYSLSWNMKSRDDLRPIYDYYDGVYGVDQPIYFIDTFAADKNLLPQYWATPALGARDAPQLVGVGDDQRPTLIGTDANYLGLPSYSAQFDMTYPVRASVYIPVPKGHLAYIGAYGTSAGGNVTVTPASGPTTVANSIDLTLLTVDNPGLFSTTLSGDDYPGFYLGLTGNTGSITLSGLMVQVLPVGTVAVTGRWVSGQGHSGCSFAGDPTLTQYSAAIDKVGLAIDLIETEAWRAN